ncbi:hypothetical protein BMS3Abin02_01867 [bacterium BMS3Abin02]|nr:hypothetical protein BMS3Abin02_01867 [bacterium BMS3Abin02]GBE22440.1 hypothetical protein BMS3Bbin01_01815 [bacterium BMS3Bbin01]
MLNEDTDSKERLLAAAWDLVITSFSGDEDGRATKTSPRVFDQLTAARISRHAGLTTGAFYNRWLDREAFMADFLEYALSVSRSEAMANVAELFAKIDSLGPSQMAIETIKRTIEATTHDPAFAIQLYLWALAKNRKEVLDDLRVGYQETREGLQMLLQGFLAEAGRELRPPFTNDLAASMMIALVEGASLQRGIDPEAFDLEQVGNAIIAIWAAMSRVPGDERTGTDIFKHGL